MGNIPVFDDVQRIMGRGIIREDVLTRIVEQAWADVPADKRAGYTAVQWRDDIYHRCMPALKKAKEQLVAKNQDHDRALQAKLRLLQDAFARQINTVMREVAFRQQGRKEKKSDLPWEAVGGSF